MPVRNEAGNVAPLVAEIAAALQGRAFEIVYVDDGSQDATADELRGLMAQHPWLRQIRHAQSCGQSAAVRSGVAAARAPIVATLDGDGQNDPAYLPALIAALEAGAPRLGLVAGQRDRAQEHRLQALAVAHRQWRAQRRAQRRHARYRLRPQSLSAAIVFLALPYFDGLHRFLPALVRRDGFDVGYVDVVDRPRRHGTSNYGFFDRLWIGILDLAGVWWLIRRKKRVPQSEEITLAR